MTIFWQRVCTAITAILVFIMGYNTGVKHTIREYAATVAQYEEVTKAKWQELENICKAVEAKSKPKWGRITGNLTDNKKVNQ